MKKVWWILSIVAIVVIASFILMKSELLNPKTNCINTDSSTCDLSCEIDNDCKFKSCLCANINEEIIEDENKKGVCYASKCECINNKCTGVIEYCTTLTNNSIEGDGAGMTLEEHYDLSCGFQTKQECENDSIDIVGYNTAKGTFGEPDGLPDCKWVLEYPESIFIPSSIYTQD